MPLIVFPAKRGAIDDLSARARLGHHLADSLIGLLVDSSFEKGATDLLRQNAPLLDAAARGKAAAFLEASTLDRDIELGLAGEAKFARLSWEKLAAQTPEERLEAIQIVGIQNGRCPP